MLYIDVKVVPLSGRTALIKNKQGVLKVYLMSAPEAGKANKELVSFLAKQLKISQCNIEIKQGLTCAKKRIAIYAEFSMEQFLIAFGIDSQKSII